MSSDWPKHQVPRKLINFPRQPFFRSLRACVAGNETIVSMVIYAFFGLYHVLNPALIPLINIHNLHIFKLQLWAMPFLAAIVTIRKNWVWLSPPLASVRTSNCKWKFNPVVLASKAIVEMYIWAATGVYQWNTFRDVKLKINEGWYF